jgi:hypothetical protein
MTPDFDMIYITYRSYEDNNVLLIDAAWTTTIDQEEFNFYLRRI